MAEAAFANTPEYRNFVRLQRLMKEGTVIIRGLFDSIHKPSNLPQVLQNRKPTLEDLKKKKIINKSEWKKLYPSDTTYGESKNFDLSLSIKMLRNICNLNPSANWDELPNDSDQSLEANLARLKYYRNEIIAHTADMELCDHDFNQYWEQIQEAVLRIRRHYSPADVEDWRKIIEKNRKDPVSDEEIKALDNQFPGMGRDEKTDRQTDRQTDEQLNREANRQTNR